MMSDIGSVQTIGNTVDLANKFQNQANHNNSFQQGLKYEPLLSVNDGSVPPLEINILGVEKAELSISQNISENIVKADTDYRNLVSKLNAWPEFSGYMEKHGVSVEGAMNKEVGITHVSNVDEIQSAASQKDLSVEERLEVHRSSMQEMQTKQMNMQSAGIEYSKDSTIWSMNTTFWLSKVKILTAAVSQVSSGLKTLFMSQ